MFREKEKMLVATISFLTDNVFYPINDKSKHLNNSTSSSAKSLNLVASEKCLVKNIPSLNLKIFIPFI